MSASRWLRADLLITVGFLILFAWAILQARAWPFRTSLFPVITASIMLALTVLKLLLDLRQAARPLPAAAPTDGQIALLSRGTGELVEEERVAEVEAEDIFATAPRAIWLAALGWLAVFFAMLWTLGMLVTVPLFSLLYLRVVSRESTTLCVLYAASAWIFIYALFDQLLHVPLPTGAVFRLLSA